ncbi:MAG: hypothetical protein ACR2MK_08975, partial [Solirubrobacteraceae bacterium]
MGDSISEHRPGRRRHRCRRRCGDSGRHPVRYHDRRRHDRCRRAHPDRRRDHHCHHDLRRRAHPDRRRD